MFFLFLFFYDFFFFIRMVPVTKYIKGTTLVRNTYLPITEMNDSQGLLQRIEEEKNDNDKADIRSLRGNLETLRMDHDAFWTSAEREKKDIHQKIETLEVIHTTEFRILLNCPFLNWQNLFIGTHLWNQQALQRACHRKPRTQSWNCCFDQETSSGRRCMQSQSGNREYHRTCRIHSVRHVGGNHQWNNSVLPYNFWCRNEDHVEKNHDEARTVKGS